MLCSSEPWTKNCWLDWPFPVRSKTLFTPSLPSNISMEYFPLSFSVGSLIFSQSCSPVTPDLTLSEAAILASLMEKSEDQDDVKLTFNAWDGPITNSQHPVSRIERRCLWSELSLLSKVNRSWTSMTSLKKYCQQIVRNYEKEENFSKNVNTSKVKSRLFQCTTSILTMCKKWGT